MTCYVLLLISMNTLCEEFCWWLNNVPRTPGFKLNWRITNSSSTDFYPACWLCSRIALFVRSHSLQSGVYHVRLLQWWNTTVGYHRGLPMLKHQSDISTWGNPCALASITISSKIAMFPCALGPKYNFKTNLQNDRYYTRVAYRCGDGFLV